MKTLSTLPHAPLGIGLKLQLVIEFTRFPASFYISQVWCCQNAVVTKVLWVSSKLPEIPSMEAHCRRQWENDVQKCSGAYTRSFKMRSRPWTDSLSSTLYINRPPIWSMFYLCTVILGLLFITLINKNPWHSQAVDKYFCFPSELLSLGFSNISWKILCYFCLWICTQIWIFPLC